MLAKFIYLMPLLPLLAAFWIGIGYLFNRNRGETGEKTTAKLATASSLSALILILLIDIQVLFTEIPGQVILGNWLSSGKYQVNFSFYLDSLSLVLLTLMSLISFLTIRFSINYMHREASFQRFFMILLIFSAAMFLIVGAGNMVLTFAGWEMAGICSYLLIAYNFDRSVPAANASRIVITNRIGDAGLIAGIILSFMWIGYIEWADIIQQPNALSSMQSGLILGGFLLAALVKSAQFPFSPWITRALEGPTPSSAIFYGSLMVHSGVYLMLRLQPLLEQNGSLMVIIAISALSMFCRVSLFFSQVAKEDMVLSCLGWPIKRLTIFSSKVCASWARVIIGLIITQLLILSNQKRCWLAIYNSLKRFANQTGTCRDG